MANDLVMNGVPWFDERGETVNAHGVCVVEDDGKYYLFGEYKSDDVNKFHGFSCYSSGDLCNWRFEGLALPPQESGLLGPDRIGERPKVMKCPKTGKYVMLAHCDDMRYSDPTVGVAVADTITGPYRLVGALEYHGEPIRRWDIGSFQDRDGAGYLLLHEGDIYRLSDDYLSAEEKVAENIAEGGESPAMFRGAGDDGLYYVMFSNKTSWGSNDNFYLTAPSPAGPWTNRGLFAPEGSCTYDSQCSFIFPLTLADGSTQPVYMGDRWSFPHQVSAATQVWLPLKASGEKLSLPDEFWTSWDPKTGERAELTGEELAVRFASNVAGASVEFPFDGARISLYADVDLSGAYGTVEILDAEGNVVDSHVVTFYGPAPVKDAIRYTSPFLPQGEHYRLRVTVSGDKTEWFYKSGARFGCSDTFVRVAKAVVW